MTNEGIFVDIIVQVIDSISKEKEFQVLLENNISRMLDEFMREDKKSKKYFLATKQHTKEYCYQIAVAKTLEILANKGYIKYEVSGDIVESLISHIQINNINLMF